MRLESVGAVIHTRPGPPGSGVASSAPVMTGLDRRHRRRRPEPCHWLPASAWQPRRQLTSVPKCPEVSNASCTGGRVVTGGGYEIAGSDEVIATIHGQRRYQLTVTAVESGQITDIWSLQAFAICATIAPEAATIRS